MLYRRVLAGDFEKIIALQNENLLAQLDVTEREDGFLSTAFTLEQFKRMDEELCVVIAENEAGELCGYLAGTRLAFNKARPIPAAMIERCSHILYDGIPLTSHHCFVANPLCIAKKYRGTDVFVKICEKLLELVQKDHRLVLAFISTENPRSLNACEKKMHMQVVGRFEAGEEAFHILVRDFR